jgi:cell division protein FtsQ
LTEGRTARARLRAVPGGPDRAGQAAVQPTLRMAPPDPQPGLARIPRGWLVAAVLLAALAYAGLHTSVFLVRQVRVTGLVQLTEADVVDAAAILPGTYLWQVRPWTVARRLSALPLLAAVRVRLLWPDAVRLEVTERQPAVLLDVGESADLEVDAAGRVIALAAPPGQRVSAGLLPPPRVPLVRGVTAAAGAQPGQVLHDPALANAIAVAEGLGVQGQALLGTLSVDDRGEVTAELASGLRVRFGDGSQARQKTELLLGLLRVIAARGMKVDEIDLASPAAPSVHVVTPEPAATASATAAPAATAPTPAAASTPVATTASAAVQPQAARPAATSTGSAVPAGAPAGQQTPTSPSATKASH